MAQRGGDDELADRLGGISLESVSAGEGKSPIGPAGLIHKVRNVTPHLPTPCLLVCSETRPLVHHLVSGRLPLTDRSS